MKGYAIAGLVLSIVGLVSSIFGTIFSLVALPISIVGLVLSIVGGKKLQAAGQPKGLATAGMVVGIIAVILSAIAFFTCGLCTMCVLAADNAIDQATNSALEDIFSGMY